MIKRAERNWHHPFVRFHQIISTWPKICFKILQSNSKPAVQNDKKRSFCYHSKLLSVSKAFVQHEEEKETRERGGDLERKKRRGSCTDIYTAAKVTKSCGMLQVADPGPAPEELVLAAGPLHSRPEWFHHLKKGVRQGADGGVITGSRTGQFSQMFWVFYGKDFSLTAEILIVIQLYSSKFCHIVCRLLSHKPRWF